MHLSFLRSYVRLYHSRCYLSDLGWVEKDGGRFGHVEHGGPVIRGNVPLPLISRYSNVPPYLRIGFPSPCPWVPVVPGAARKAEGDVQEEGGRRCRPRKGRGSSAAAGSTGGSSPPGPSDRRRRSRAAVLRAARKQLGDLLDAAVDAAPVDSAAALGAAAAADVADQVADAITA